MAMFASTVATMTHADEVKPLPAGLDHVKLTTGDGIDRAAYLYLFEDERLFQLSWTGDATDIVQTISVLPEGSFDKVRGVALAQLDVLVARPADALPPSCMGYGIDILGVFTGDAPVAVATAGCPDAAVSAAMQKVHDAVGVAGGSLLE